MPYINELLSKKKSVVAIGKFDGVHIGHRELLKHTAALAGKEGLVSVCFIINSKSGKTLSDDKEREQYIKSLGIDFCYIQELNSDFMSMSAEEFADEILFKSLNCAHVVVGYNFRFAKGRSADANDLKSLCFEKSIECTIIPEVTCLTSCKEKITVSSSAIRESLSTGNVKDSFLLLGRPYTISGKVVHGRKIGRSINFPTANIECKSTVLLPKPGVYMANVCVDGTCYKSVTNIGDNPTVKDDGIISVESNILGFDGDIYGKEITVEFLDRIRDEKKFDSLEELKKQIQSDIEFVLLTK